MDLTSPIFKLISLIVFIGVFHFGLYIYSKTWKIHISKNGWMIILLSEVIALLIVYFALFKVQ